MPIFEYKCIKCGKISEYLERASASIKRRCPHCGSTSLDEQFSVFAAQVKEEQSKKCLGCIDTGYPYAKG